MGTRVFVTGATGVVGIRAVPLLVGAGHDVTAVGRTPEKRARLESLGARAVALDMFDPVAVKRALEGQDAVINLATHMPPSAFKMLMRRQWRETDRIRREGSAVFVDAAIATGVKRFLQESFAPVYEDGGDRWIDETWPGRSGRRRRRKTATLHASLASGPRRRNHGIAVALPAREERQNEDRERLGAAMAQRAGGAAGRGERAFSPVIPSAGDLFRFKGERRGRQTWR